MIIQRSVENIQRRAMEQNVIRKSPERYKKVKSKVSRCIKVQNKVIKSKTAKINKEKM